MGRVWSRFTTTLRLASSLVLLAMIPGPSALAGGDGTWIPGPGANFPGRPSGRVDHACAYDGSRHRMLVFGGSPYGLNDTWELNLAAPGAWKLIPPTGALPPARNRHAAVYDPVRDRLIVLGGITSGCANDVWALSQGAATPQWTQITVAGPAPPAREGTCAAYDPVRDRLVLLTGNCNTQYFDDVWALNLAGIPAWSKIVTTGTGPSARTHACAAYDPAADRILMFGGVNGPSYLNDLWELSLWGTPTWNPITPAGTAPQGRAFAVGAFDSQRNRFVVSGGLAQYGAYLADVAVAQLGSDPAWISEPNSTGPTARMGAAGVCDPLTDGLVVFGGYTVDMVDEDDVWEWSFASAQWTRLWPRGTPEQPPARADHAAVFDPVRRKLTIVGGYNTDGGTPDLTDVWRLDLTSNPTWSMLPTTGTVLPPREGHVAIVDLLDDQMLVYGGVPTANELWALPLGAPWSWTRVSTLGTSPGPEGDVGAIYDPIRQRMLTIGGSPGTGWGVYSVSLGATPQWSKIIDDSQGPRTAIWETSAVYDAAGDQMVVVGGYGAAEVWALRLGAAPQWVQLSPAVGPQVRSEGAIAFDPAGRRLWVVGGWGPGYYLADIWEFDLAPAPQWRQLSPTGPSPLPRGFMTVNYDPNFDRLVLVGGHNGRYLGDTWYLQFDHPTPALASSVSAEAGITDATLVWYLGPSAQPLVVERCAARDPWRPVGSPVVDGAGYARFHDHNLDPDTRYGYRVSWSESARSIRAGEVWVETRSRERFAVLAPSPNPAVRTASITVSLPDQTPAWLEVYDIQGRCLSAREIGSLGPGSHTVPVVSGRLEAGLYFVVVRRSTETQTRQLVILN